LVGVLCAFGVFSAPPTSSGGNGGRRPTLKREETKRGEDDPKHEKLQ
jgi:hypothetical protein